MTSEDSGRIIAGDEALFRRSFEAFQSQPVDQTLTDGHHPAPPSNQQTIREPITLTGPGTFLHKATRTITLEPTEMSGWWFDRTDLPEDLATRVSIRNVWTTGEMVSNIVLRSGSPHNYVRMVEHLIALKIGMGIDNLMIRIDSGDPPIFDRGSLDLVKAVEQSGFHEQDIAARYVTVKEKVTIVDGRGGFLILSPCTTAKPQLNIDCAIDFPNAIGKQRIRFPLINEYFRYGSEARTNTSSAQKLYSQTIGKIFADVRNLGYTKDNVLIAGRRKYVNAPKLLHEGKSLEAAWHRAAMDLLAAVALIDKGRFVGDVVSYKAGHRLDVRMITLLYMHGLLEDFTPSA